MAKFSMKKGGKEVGPASVYAAPHHTPKSRSKTTNQDSKKKGLTINQLDISRNGMADPNTLKANQFKPDSDEQGVPRVSLGDPGPGGIETSGVKIRGTGAATKGLYARGPMA